MSLRWSERDMGGVGGWRKTAGRNHITTLMDESLKKLEELNVKTIGKPCVSFVLPRFYINTQISVSL